MHLRALIVFFSLLMASASYGVNVYTNNFESTSGTFDQTGSTHGLWGWGIPTKTLPAGIPASAYSGSRCWGINLGGLYYPRYEKDYLALMNVNLTSYCHAELSFAWLLHAEPNYDGGTVQVSTNAGTTWSTLGAQYNPYHKSYIAGNGLPAWSCASTSWSNTKFSLAPYAGKTVSIRFVFGSDSIITNYAGWFLDDLVIKGIGPAAGTGTMNLTNSNPITRQSTTGSWRWSYRSTRLLERTRLTFLIPTGWTTPQTTTPGAAGFIRVYPLLGTIKMAPPSIVSNKKVVIYLTNMPTSARFTIVYSNATPATSGDCEFTTKIAATNESFQEIAIQPTITVPMTAALPLSDNMETYSATRYGVFAGSKYKQWEWGTPKYVGPSSAASGSSCWGTKISNNITRSGSPKEYLYLPAMNLTSATYGSLTFKQWYYFYYYYDGGNLQYSTDNGLTWNVYGTLGDPYTYSITSLASAPGYGYDTSSTWQTAEFDLTPLVGNYVMFRLQLGVYSSGSARPGWYIDDLTMTALPVPAAGSGTIAISPSSVLAQTTNTFRLPYTAAKQIYNGYIRVLIPASWTTPQAVLAGTAGYVYAVPVSGGPVIKSAPAVAGMNVTVTVTNMPKGSSFVLVYSNAKAPINPGDYTFTTTSAGFGESLTALSLQPVANVIATISSFPYFDNFEKTTNLYSTAGSTHFTWSQGIPTYSAPTPAAFSGSKCWSTGLSSYYWGSYIRDRFSLPVINLTAENYGSLSFYYSYSTSYYDGANVTISTNFGSTWMLLGSYPDDYPSSYVYGTASAGLPTEGWNGSTYGSWQKEEFDLTPYKGKKCFVRLNFATYAYYYSSYPGIFVDDLKIAAIPPSSRGTGSAQVTPTIVVRNLTNTFQMTYSAAKKIYGGEISFTIATGFTAPQTASSALPGFVRARALSGSPRIKSQPTISGRDVLVYVTNMSPYDQIVLVYTNAAAPNSYGERVFTVASRSFGESFSNLSQPLSIGVLDLVGTFPYFDDFETDTGRYMESGSTYGTWAWGVPTFNTPWPAAYSGTKCWSTGLSTSYYGSYILDNLYAPVVNLTGQNYGFLSFRYAYYTASPYDGGNVTFSTNLGKTWAALGAYPDIYNTTYVYGLDSAGLPTEGWNGWGLEWKKADIDLTPYKGKKVMLRFNFATYAYLYGGYPGIFLDDLQIGNKPPSVQGSGTAQLSPDIVIKAQTNTMRLTYTADRVVYDGQIRVTIATGFSAPQTNNISALGYVRARGLSGTPRVRSKPSISGRMVTVYVTNMKKNDQIVLVYSNAAVPAWYGEAAFTVESRVTNEAFGELAVSPSVGILDIIKTFPFSDNFESDSSRYLEAGSTHGYWNWGTPIQQPNPVYSGSRCRGSWITNQATGPASDRLYLPVIDLTGKSFGYLSFYAWYSMINWGSPYDDGVNLSYSTNLGTTWSPLGSYPDEYNASSLSRLGGEPGFTSYREEWTRYDFDLTPFKGRKVMVRINLGAYYPAYYSWGYARGFFFDDLYIKDSPIPAAGSGTNIVFPNFIEKGAAGTDTFTFTFRATKPIKLGQVSIEIPSAFTMPQNSVVGNPGYVRSYPGTGSPVISTKPSLSSRTVIVSVTNMKKNDTFILIYSNATVPTLTGDFAFTTKSKTFGEVSTPIATSPQIAALESVSEYPFLDGFELGATKYPEAGSTLYQWEQGIPTAGPGAAFAGDQCLGLNLSGNYSEVQNDYCYLPVLDLSGRAYASLSFESWIETESGGSGAGGDIEYSTNRGRNWAVLGSYPYDYNASWINSLGGAGFSGTGDGWSGVSFNLTHLVDKKVFLRLRFANIGYEPKSGWYIDNLEIRDAPPSVAGKGSVSVTPALTIRDSTKDFQIVYTAAESIYNGRVEFELPAGWSAPQVSDSSGAGFVTNQPVPGISLPLSISGNKVLFYVDSLPEGDSIVLEYKNSIVPSTPGDASIVIRSAGDNETLTELADPAAVTILDMVSLPFRDDFESAAYSYSQRGSSAALWERGIPANVGPSAAYSGQSCYGTVIDGPYEQIDSVSYLYMPALDLTSAVNAYFGFRNWYDTEYKPSLGVAFDAGNLEISTDGGVFFSTLGWNEYNDPGWASWLGSRGFGGSSGGWVPAAFDLTPYVGNKVIIRFKFVARNALNDWQWWGPSATYPGDFPGWYVDDFFVTNARPPFAGSGQLSYSPANVTVASQYTFYFDYNPQKVMENGVVRFQIPADFTPPQTAVPGTPGFVTFSWSSGSFGPITITSNVIEVPVIWMNTWDGFGITYEQASCSTPGRKSIPVSSAAGSETPVLLENQPMITVSPILTLPVVMDFEANDGLLDYSDGWKRLWEYGVPKNVGPSTAYSGTNCWGTVLDGNFNAQSFQEILRSPTIDLSGLTNGANLSFRYYSDLYTSSDNWRVREGAWVSIEWWDGWSWNNQDIGTYPGQYNFNSGVINPWSGNCWVGKTEGWKEASFDISAFSNKRIRIRWNFRGDGDFKSDIGKFGYEFPGFYLDDVKVLPGAPQVAGKGSAFMFPFMMTVSGSQDLNVAYKSDRQLKNARISFTFPDGFPSLQRLDPALPGYVKQTNSWLGTTSAQFDPEPVISGRNVTWFITNMSAGDVFPVGFLHMAAPGQSGNYEVLIETAGEFEELTAIESLPEINVVDVISTFPYAEDFEDSDGGFKKVNFWPDGKWEFGKPTTGPGSAWSGTNCWGTGTSGLVSSPNNTSYIMTPFFDLAGLSTAAMSFYIYYDMDLNWNYTFAAGHTVISTNGIDYLPIGTYPGQYDANVPYLNVSGPDKFAWTGRSAGWRKIVMDLTPYIGKIVSFGFGFQTDSWFPGGMETGTPGIFLDDFTVSDTPLIAGTGACSVAPAVTQPSTVQDIKLGFTAGTPMKDSYVSITIPEGWTEPQTGTLSSPGYLSVRAPDGGIDGFTLAGSGPWTVTVNLTNLAQNSSFTLTYAQAEAPAISGVSIFTTRSWSSLESPKSLDIEPRVYLLASVVPPATLNFDANDGGCLTLGSRYSLWQWGTPGWGPPSTHSGTKCWGTVLNGNYAQSWAQEYLLLPIIDLTGTSVAALTYYQWYKTASEDGLNVSVSTNFEDFTVVGSYPSDYNSPDLYYDSKIFTWEAGSTGDSSGWKRKSIDLTPFAGRKILLRFNFYSDNMDNAYPGWYIDSVSVSPSRPPVAGTGTFSATPDRVYQNSTNIYEFLYTSEEKINDGNVKIGLPTGWPTPQKSTSSSPGYVTVLASSSAFKATIANISSMTVNIRVTNMGLGQWVKLRYRNVKNIDAGSFTVAASSAGTGENFQALSTQPTLVVQGIISSFPQLWNFEDDSGTFYASGASSLWQWGEATFGPPTPSASDGSKCWGTALAGPYAVNKATNEYILSPPINLTAASQVFVSFQHYYDTEEGFDSLTGDAGNLTVSTSSSLADLGKTFVIAGDYPTVYNKQTLVWLNNKPGWSGKSGAWVKQTLDLSAFKHKYIQLKFRFATDLQNAQFPGWYVDDIEVANTAPIPADVPFENAGRVFKDEFGKSVPSYDTYGIESCDVDGNGVVDLLTAAYGSSYNYVFENDGTPVLTRTRSAGTFSTFKFRTADVDNDGDIDAFAVDCAGDSDNTEDFGDSSLIASKPNYILLNNGQGEFTVNQAFLDDKSRDARFGDLDADGDMDIFVANLGPNKILVNNGDGLFSESSAILPGINTTAVRLGDLDGDGDLDAILGHWKGEPNLMLFNDGTGRFTTSAQNLGYYRTVSCDLADVDSDGDLDVLFGTLSGMHLWLNDGSGSFTETGEERFIVSRTSLRSNIVWGVGFGDADNDGQPDIYTANYKKSDMIWINDGAGYFRAEERNYLGSFASRDLTLFDANRDGRLDFAVANSLFQENRLWMNRIPASNQPPAPPGSLAVSFSGNDATATWTAGSDNETPAGLLTYNLRIGTKPGACDILSTPDLAFGTGPGNAGMALTKTIRSLDKISHYYFQVQTVDAGFQTSSWRTFVYYHDPEAPEADTVKLSENFLRLDKADEAIVSFNLSKSMETEIYVYDIRGVRVRSLLEKKVLPAGYNYLNNIVWDGTDDSGKKLAPGLYWVVLKGKTFTNKQKILLAW